MSEIINKVHAMKQAAASAAKGAADKPTEAPTTAPTTAPKKALSKDASAPKIATQDAKGNPLTPLEIFKQVQTVLKVSKSKLNKFANFHYRSVEDIYNGFKSLGAPLILTLSDEIISAGNKVFVEATATVTDLQGNVVSKTKAHAELGAGKAGMSSEQATGSASSYARKYALNGLFLLDDTEDLDSLDNSTSNTNAVSAVNTDDATGKVLDNQTAIRNLQNLIQGNAARIKAATDALKGRTLLKMSVADINAIIEQVKAIN